MKIRHNLDKFFREKNQTKFRQNLDKIKNSFKIDTLWNNLDKFRGKIRHVKKNSEQITI